MEIIINQALSDLLIEKGIIAEEKLMLKVKVLKSEMALQE